jgi:hypothetical protein
MAVFPQHEEQRKCHPNKASSEVISIKHATELTLRQAGSLSGEIRHYWKKFEEEP